MVAPPLLIVVVVFVLLGVEERLLEGIEVEVEFLSVILRVEFVDAPSGAHAGAQGLTVKLCKGSITTGVGHIGSYLLGNGGNFEERGPAHAVGTTGVVLCTCRTYICVHSRCVWFGAQTFDWDVVHFDRHIRGRPDPIPFPSGVTSQLFFHSVVHRKRGLDEGR